MTDSETSVFQLSRQANNLPRQNQRMKRANIPAKRVHHHHQLLKVLTAFTASLTATESLCLKHVSSIYSYR